MTPGGEPEGVVLALRHPDMIRPETVYKVQVLDDPRRPESLRTVEIAGALLMDFLLDANRPPARVIAPRAVIPLLDLWGYGGMVWCDASEARGKIASGMYVALTLDGYVKDYVYGRATMSAAARAATVWSGWRRAAETAAQRTTESEEAAPEPAPRRPFQAPRPRKSKSEGGTGNG